MSDESGLIAAVIAAPDDDLPRLVYADWLEEHGETDYAEFIRLQCEIAQRYDEFEQVSPDEPLKKRERELWPKVRDAYPQPFGGVRRGFAEFFVGRAEDWLDWADEYYWHPSQGRPCPPTAQPVTRVWLTTHPDDEGWEAGRFRQVIDERVDAAAVFYLTSPRWPGVEFELRPGGRARLDGRELAPPDLT